MIYRFEDSPGKLTQELSKAYGNALLSKIKKKGYDIGIPEWSTLSFLSSKKQANQNEIANFLGVGKVFVKRLVDRMERKNLVHRTTSQADMRFNIIQLTPFGLATFTKIKPLAENTIRQACNNISKEEYSQFLHIMEKMKENLILAE